MKKNSIFIISLLLLVSVIVSIEHFTKETIQQTQQIEFLEPYNSSHYIDYKHLKLEINKYTRNMVLAEKFAGEIISISYDNNLNPWLIFSIIAKESSFRSSVESSVGAVGLMQIMPFWIKEIGVSTDNLYEYRTNLYYGCYILNRYIKRYKTLDKALAAYNGSKGSQKYPNAVKKIFLNYSSEVVWAAM